MVVTIVIVNVPALQAIAGIIGAFAALLAGIYAVVTRPLLVTLVRIEGELKDIRGELKTHGERLAKLEERIPPLVRR
jgi:hypothetical protein